MIRETSKETYYKIKSEGLLSERRWQVYDILYQQGPLTGSEMAVRFKAKYGSLSPNAGNMVTRLGELRNSGAVKEVGTKICSITDQTVILWDVTKEIPKKVVKIKTSACLLCGK